MKAADIAEFIKVCSKLFITCWGARVPEPRLMGHEDKIGPHGVAREMEPSVLKIMRLPQGLGPVCWLWEGGRRQTSPPGTLEPMPRIVRQPAQVEEGPQLVGDPGPREGGPGGPGRSASTLWSASANPNYVGLGLV